MHKPFALTALFLAVVLQAAHADIVYDFSVDTSSISRTAGFLDFNFNPGPLVTQSASLQILNFASDGTLGTGSCLLGGPCRTGNVSGTLPGTLSFDNGTPFNDYFQGFTFGSSLSFDVRLYGPAVNAPDVTSTSGSTFAFSMFSDAAGTMPALTTDLTDGFAARVDLNLDGTATVTDFSAETSITTPIISPEPSMFAVTGIFLGLIGGAVRLRRRVEE